MKRENAARLLGPVGKLSRLEKDAIFDRVVDGIDAQGSWFSRYRVALSAATVALAAAAILFVVWPKTSSGPSTLVARGSATLPLVIRCGAREPGQCQRGDRLTFDFGSTIPAGYVALFARGESGQVFWYVPAEEETASVALAAHASAGVLDTVAVIDEAYRAGRYDVFAVVSPQPLTRAEIRAFARGDQLAAPPGVHIESRSFVVRTEESL